MWVSETWGSGTVVLATWVAAHTERIGVGVGAAAMPARTPAGAATAAITIDHLSGGRFRLGLGTSGPQVAEGWHGVVFDDPLDVRASTSASCGPSSPGTDGDSEGQHYRLPAAGGTGLGKPLMTNVQPLRAEVPIYLAAMGPPKRGPRGRDRRRLDAAALLPRTTPMSSPAPAEGATTRDPGRSALDVAPMVFVALGTDLDACRDAVRPMIAFYVGAYGSRSVNFYRALVVRYGTRPRPPASRTSPSKGNAPRRPRSPTRWSTPSPWSGPSGGWPSACTPTETPA